MVTYKSKNNLVICTAPYYGKHHCWSTQIWAACNKGITQFYLPPTHEPCLPLLLGRKAAFGWYSLRLPTKGWTGWVNLGGWPHTEINVPHWELNPDTVTHLSTNRARRWLTSLIEANALTTTPGHHLRQVGNLHVRHVVSWKADFKQWIIAVGWLKTEGYVGVAWKTISECAVSGWSAAGRREQPTSLCARNNDIQCFCESTSHGK